MASTAQGDQLIVEQIQTTATVAQSDQLIVEQIQTTATVAQSDQLVLEIITNLPPTNARVDQVEIEIFGQPVSPSTARVDQVEVEVFGSFPAPIPPTATLQNMGVWFDFNKLDETGLPTAGEINGMNVAGAVSLRGPLDDGNVAWIDSSQNRVGRFGLGFSDFGAPINTLVYGLGDFFTTEFGSQAPLWNKVVQTAALLLGIPLITSGQTQIFNVSLVTDLLTNTKAAALPTIGSASVGGTWGQNWGTMVWSALSTQSAYFIAQVFGQLPVIGHIIQIGIQESSVYPWTLMGYTYELNTQKETR